MPRISLVAALAVTAVLIVPSMGAAQQDVPAEQAQTPSPEPSPEPQASAPEEEARDLQSPPAAGRPVAQRRVAVLLLAAGGVESETADALTELAIGTVAARGGVTIVGKEEFQAQLGQGEARTLECIGSAACLGRVGVELDVHEVVAGTVGRRGDSWTFNLNRIDIRTGQLTGRAFREVEGDLGAVADAIEEALPALYEVVRSPARLTVSSNVDGAELFVDGMLVGAFRGDSPVVVEEIQPGPHEIAVHASGHEPWSRTVNVAEGATLQLDASLDEMAQPGAPYVSPLVWVGGGVAVVGASVAVFFGVSSQRTWEERDNRGRAVEFVEARELDALIANAAMAGAAAGLVTLGVGMLLSDFDGEPAPGPRVGITPVEGGSLLQVEGRF